MTELPFLKLDNGEIIKCGDVKKTINGELTIQKFSYGFDIASRTSIINHLINKYDLKSYLELGVRDGRNYNRINIKNKIGVDPYPVNEMSNIYKMTSDKFFEINKNKFDIIFIDGLHDEKQVDKDIVGSLNFLSDKGFIIMHDCNPPTEFHQRDKYEVNGEFPPWNGTVWRSFAKLRRKKLGLNLCCIDCDWGVGIIKKGNSEPFKLKGKLNYNFLNKNRKDLLNLKSVNEFINNF